MLNSVGRLVDMWGGEQVYSCSLGAGRMVSFTPRLLYSRGQWPSVAARLVVEWRADQVWMSCKTDSLVHSLTHSIHSLIHSFVIVVILDCRRTYGRICWELQWNERN